MGIVSAANHSSALPRLTAVLATLSHSWGMAAMWFILGIVPLGDRVGSEKSGLVTKSLNLMSFRKLELLSSVLSYPSPPMVP